MFGTYVPAAQRRPEARIMSINRKYHISNLDDSESSSPVQQEQFDDSTSGALPSNGNSQANIQVDMSAALRRMPRAAQVAVAAASQEAAVQGLSRPIQAATQMSATQMSSIFRSTSVAVGQ